MRDQADEVSPEQVEAMAEWEAERSKLAAIAEQAVRTFDAATKLAEMTRDRVEYDRAFACRCSAAFVGDTYRTALCEHDKKRT